MSQKQTVELDEGVAAIRAWLRKEHHLPDDMDELHMKRFLHSCDHNVASTVKCLERFFCMRRDNPQLFADRDPLANSFQTAFSITNFCTYNTDDDRRITVYQLNDPTLEKFICNDILRSFIMQADTWLHEEELMFESDVIIMDCRHLPFKIITKLNLFMLRSMIIYLLEAMPLRMKGIHLVNCASFIDKLYALVKPVIPSEINRLVHFHSGTDTLYEYIDKRWLPKELGGEAGPMTEQMKDWVARMERKREFFLNNDQWRAATKKKGKSKSAVENINNDGTYHSFSSLCID